MVDSKSHAKEMMHRGITNSTVVRASKTLKRFCFRCMWFWGTFLRLEGTGEEFNMVCSIKKLAHTSTSTLAGQTPA